MSRAILLVILLVCLSASLSWSAPGAQTHPWRIAIGGAYTTGYIGLMALHGFPRERITDEDLADVAKLRQYNMVFLAMRGMAGDAISAPLEQYLREGGIVVAETGLIISNEAVPGRRIGPFPHPNIRFVDSGTPITQGLPQLGVIPITGQAMTVVPDAGAKVTVLASFTEEDAPARTRGYFVTNGQGAPAIFMAEVGKGKLIYSAPSIGFNLSLRGQQFEPFLVNLIKYLSNGELDDRVYTGTLQRSELVTAPPQETPSADYPAPAGQPTPPPAGFEVLADAKDLTDFALTGKLKAGASADLLVSHWSPSLSRELLLDKGKAVLRRTANTAAPVTVASGTLPAGDLDLLIMRRSGLLTVEANHQVVLCACDGPFQQGALAVKGLDTPAYQPLDQVHFEDDFMRDSSTEEEWQQVAGRWQIMAAEGKPDMGANPFDYVATATDKAVALNGSWFWSDYAYDVSVKCAAPSAGLMADYRKADDYLALRLSFEQKPAKLQLVRVKPAGSVVLGEAPVDAKQDDWQRLGIRTSNGIVEGLLDGRVVLQARQPDVLCGQIGLLCEKGQANFDDIDVRPWTAAGLSATPASQLMVLQGDWKADRQGELLGSGSKGARAFPAWGDSGTDCTAQVEVKVGQAAAAGLHFRYVDDTKYYLMALMNDAGHLRLRLYRQGSPGAVIVEKAVAGDTSRWHRLQAEVRGGRLFAAVDGQPVIDVLDPGHRTGLVGLYARGTQPAAFRGFAASQVEPDEQLVDGVQPTFAGIIDRQTWAGRSGAWTPDPADLNCFWHHSYVPADLNLQVGVHPVPAATTTTATAYLSRDRQKGSGYALVADRTWTSPQVPLRLLRLGKEVARTTATVPAGQAFALGLLRRGTQLMVEVDNKPVAVYRDPQARLGLDCLGLDEGGSLIYADDVCVASAQVHDYTFETAPTEWTVQQGTWEITSRWSCTPGWAWFSGQNPNGYALINTKAGYTGDQDVVIYVAPKMMPAGNNRYSETFGDVYLSICSDGTTAGGGYQVAFAGVSSSYTVLRRQGQVVAQCPYRLPQSGEHNDWIRLTVSKRGSKISAWVWDAKVMEYEDKQALAAGRIVLGTHDNGIMIPRVTIFGRPTP